MRVIIAIVRSEVQRGPENLFSVEIEGAKNLSKVRRAVMIISLLTRFKRRCRGKVSVGKIIVLFFLPFFYTVSYFR